MIKGIFMAARSLNTRTKNMDVIANNLANLSTTGYKREVPFSEVLTNEGQILIKKFTDYKQGELLPTSNPLDLGVFGNSAFVIQTERGQELTRDGRFKLNDEGSLVTNDGNKVMGQNGEINISDQMLDKDQTIYISSEGELKVGDTVIDTFLMAKLDGSQEFKRTSGSNFISAEGNIEYANKSDYKINQGYLEESNINPIIEMEAMIQINNDYSSSHKVVNILDQSLEKANEMGRV
ncbi:MAG: flagellar hook basal-body protein [Ignavibacteriaceae bacterium]|nr:flagellar hook basal-body protein [Ignavibacteriaceae bacterium]